MGAYLPGQIGMNIIVIDGDLDMGNYDIKVDDILESTADNGIEVDGMDIKDKQIRECDVLMPQNKDKVASENLRHSIDAFVGYTQYVDYTQIENKIFTFTNGFKGVMRVKYLHDAGAGGTVYSRLLKNGTGASLADNSAGEAGATESNDLTVDFAPGDTLNLFGKTSLHNAHWAHFRIYYDDGTGFSAVPVAVTGAD